MDTLHQKHEFTDTEEIRQAVAAFGWDVTYTRLGPGRLGVAAWATRLGDLVLYHEHYDFPMLAYGRSSLDAYSVMVFQGGYIRLFGEELSSRSIGLFPLGAAVDAVGGADLELFSIQVSQDRLHAEAEREGVELIQAGDALVVAPGPDRIQQFRTVMHRATATLDRRGLNGWKDMEKDLLVLLVALFDKEAIARLGTRDSIKPAGEKAMAVRRYVYSQPIATLDISELAQDLGVGRHHLNRCFKEHYGVSLQDFIHFRRLHAARALLQRPPADLRVTDAAYSCGFNHLGRFSTEYKQLFGENPRQTLHQAGAST